MDWLRASVGRYVVSAAGAAMITGIPLAAGLWAMGKAALPAWVSTLLFVAELPIWPGLYFAALLGIRGGPDGMPSLTAMVVAAFVFWFALIEGIRWIHAARARGRKQA